MNYVVVGATGYIGSAVSVALEAAGHRVIRIGGPFSTNDHTQYHYREGLYTALQQELATVDGIVYAAGRVVPTTNASPNEALRLDCLPLAELLESLARCGTQPALVLISSAGAIYGPSPEGGELTEDSRTVPLSVYGLVRSEMEQLLGFSQRTRVVRGVTLRLSNVYGPEQRVNGPAAFVIRAVTAVKTGKPMELWGAGEQRKDFLFIADAVEAVQAALAYAAGRYDSAAPNVFNVCRGQSDSLLEILQMVREVTGKPVPFKTVPARSSDVPRVELSARRAAEVLKWKAATSPREGLKQTWASVSASRD